MELPKIKDCPFCDGKSSLQKEAVKLTYKCEVFDVYEYFYKCNKCNEDYTTTDSDSFTIKQAEQKHKEKYNCNL